METKINTTSTTETYKGMTIKAIEDPKCTPAFSIRYYVLELKTRWGSTWYDYGKDLAKRAITRALHGTLKNYTITYKDYIIYYAKAEKAYYICSPKGTACGPNNTFEAAKEAIDRQQKITEEKQKNPKK